MITFQTETFGKVLEEIKPLLQAHWEEIAEDKDKVPLNPDWQKYYELEKQRILYIITARHDKKLIGYNVLFVMPHLHYKTTVMAMNDILYIKPEYRKSRIGLGLIKYAEERMKEKGVFKIIYHIKVQHDIGRIFERMGYKFFEKMFGKVLEE